jgi:hypothetical protein
VEASDDPVDLNEDRLGRLLGREGQLGLTGPQEGRAVTPTSPCCATRARRATALRRLGRAAGPAPLRPQARYAAWRAPSAAGAAWSMLIAPTPPGGSGRR